MKLASDKQSPADIVRVGFFLARRYITRTSKWQTGLVIFVMTLTFLNLVAVNGVLIGLIDGSLLAYNRSYTGDILISSLPEKEEIERGATVRMAIERTPGIKDYSARIVEGGTLEANYHRAIARPDIVPDTIGVPVVGIDVAHERNVTNLNERVLEGEFLTERDTSGIMMGYLMIARHFPADIGLQTVEGVYPGDKVRLTIGNVTKEFTLRGITKTKADAADMRVYINESELRSMTGKIGPVYDEFAIRANPGTTPEMIRDSLRSYGIQQYALVRTTEEGIGEFLDEIKDTFNVLGTIIGSISVIVASITIFIIIFITAITRQKFIGILKAIGVSGVTVEFSYVVLSMFYSIIGVSVGVAILYGFLLPYFIENPIDFPFSDGILSVTPMQTLTRSIVLIITTIIAGYIPARLIVKKNTLDAIHGR